MARKKKVSVEVSVHAGEPRVPKDALAPAPYEKTEEDKEREGNYDLDHLLRAKEIESDPDRMKYVHKAHEKKTTALRSIADLKMAAQALGERERAKKFGQK